MGEIQSNAENIIVTPPGRPANSVTPEVSRHSQAFMMGGLRDTENALARSF